MSQKTTPKKPSAGSKNHGQKKPFAPDDLSTIRSVLANQERWRDLALFNVAIDTMLRSSDVLSLRVEDVSDHQGAILETFTYRQQKTGRAVLCGLTTTARRSLHHWIKVADKMPWDYLFTPERYKSNRPISSGQFRRLVKEWAQIAALDARHFSGHSTRRTKASLVFRKTGNVEAVRHLLGHASLTNTSEYLNISAESAVRQGLDVEV